VSAARVSPEQCIAALQRAAASVRTTELSTSAYEHARGASRDEMPSSAVIRRRFGNWHAALLAAGLSATPGGWERRPRDADGRVVTVTVEREAALAALRAARADTSGDLTPTRYAQWRRALPHARHRESPSARAVKRVLGSWPAALAAAGIRADDAFHPLSYEPEHHGDPAYMWTVGEVRALVSKLQRGLGLKGHVLDEATYEHLVERSPTALPPWTVVEDCMERCGCHASHSGSPLSRGYLSSRLLCPLLTVAVSATWHCRQPSAARLAPKGWP